MPSLSPRRPLVLLALIVVMAAIFLIDTVTDYAVAAACFYAAVILAASRVLSARGLITLAIACIALTGLSFFLTRFGTYRIGLVNSVIGMLVIGITTYLALNMEAAKAAVQEAQGRLLRVARASTVGELTTSIAHEVNQPLAAIASSAEACQRWLAQDPPNVDKARQTVARILADAHRAGDVIARIRGLTQGAAPERRAFDLNQAVEEMLALSRSELDQHGVAVALLLDADLPPVQADRVQVQQVIGNLILNAVDAMEGVPAADRRLSLLTRRDGQRVSLSVRDRGVGLPADHPERVFDAFWTTKSHGLGLGLSLSRSMIEANDGQIRAERPQAAVPASSSTCPSPWIPLMRKPLHLRPNRRRSSTWSTTIHRCARRWKTCWPRWACRCAPSPPPRPSLNTNWKTPLRAWCWTYACRARAGWSSSAAWAAWACSCPWCSSPATATSRWASTRSRTAPSSS